VLASWHSQGSAFGIVAKAAALGMVRLGTMKTDAYTKSVLTVIAASLLWLCLENVVHPRAVSAQNALRVVIVGIDDDHSKEFALPVQITGGAKYAHLQVNEDNPLPVSMASK
jgi:hypothetical protein